MSESNRAKWVTHNGKEVLAVSYEGLAGMDIIEIFEEGKSMVLERGTEVLIMTNFSNSKIEKEFISRAKSSGVELDHLLKRNAIIGMSGLQKILYNGYIRFTGQRDKNRLFDTEEEALSWLTED